MPIVVLTIKSVYGVPQIYPAPGNRTAELLVSLTGKKTFNARDVAAIKNLGYEIQYINAYAPEVV